MTFEEWEATAPDAMRREPVWRATAYRLGAHLAFCAAGDVLPIVRDIRFGHDIPQLVKAAGSIGGNIAEGYARRSRQDRVRFYEYALGSAAECKHWYAVLAPALNAAMIEARFEALSRISRLLLVMINNERKGGDWNDSRRIPIQERAD